MDFSKASLAELRQFTKDNGIKGCSAMKKSELAEFLTKYVEEHVTAVSVERAKTEEKNATPVVNEGTANTEYRKSRNVRTAGTDNEDSREGMVQRKTRKTVSFQDRRNQGYQQRQIAHYDSRQQGEQRQQSEYRQEQRQQSEYRQEQRQQSEYRQEQRLQTEQQASAEQSQEKRQNQVASQNGQVDYDPELDSGRQAHGILEVMPEGYGFIRSANYLPGDQDIYISPAQIRRFGLKTGDIVTGNIRNKTQGEKFSALLYVSSVNDESPATIAARKSFEDLTPIFPNERIELDGENSPIPIRMINLLAPIGKGQRGMIVSPPKTGKTTLLKQIAKKISTTYKDMHLLVLLIDERPEEVTDIRESIEGPNVEVIYSTFDELPEHHRRVSEMVIERAKRLVESRKDVVILLDSITRLARAYNLTVAPSGRTLSGGLDPAALHMPKRFFGAARNMREGGSLTILATALVDTGSRMDDVVYEEFKGTGNMELMLNRKLQEKRVFPAIDIPKSGTRREDLLLDKEEQEAAYIMRKAMNGMKAEEAVDNLLTMFSRTKNNEELVQQIIRQKFI